MRSTILSLLFAVSALLFATSAHCQGSLEGLKAGSETRFGASALSLGAAAKRAQGLERRAAGAAQAGPTDDDPSLYPKMVQFLLENGLSRESIVTDTRELLAPKAEKALLAKGFRREADGKDGSRRYALGEASMYLNGQRALFLKDGSVKLMSFANNKLNDASFCADISLSSDGKLLSKSVNRLP